MFSLRTLCVIATAFATIACEEGGESEVAPRVAELTPAEAEAFCADLETAFVPAGERFACALEATVPASDEATCERQRLRCETEKPEVCPYRDAAVRSTCPAPVDAVMACFEALGQGFEAASEVLSCSVVRDRETKTAAFRQLEGLLAFPEACKALPPACLPKKDEAERPEIEPEVDDEREDLVANPAVAFGSGDFGLVVVADSDLELCALEVTCAGDFSPTAMSSNAHFEGDSADRFDLGEDVCEDGPGGRLPTNGIHAVWFDGDGTDCTARLQVRGGAYRVYRCTASNTEECLAGEPLEIPGGDLDMSL